MLAEPAVRIFRQGSAAVYAYEVYDGTPRDTSTLTATSTLLRDGRLVHQGAAVPVESKGMVGRLALAKDMSPGFYTLRITVARVRNGTAVTHATQWATFEVFEL